jgi:hypothetical protein
MASFRMRFRTLGQRILIVTMAHTVWWGVFTGCAGQTTVARGDERGLQTQSRNGEAIVRGSRHLLRVPFFPDETDQCGPATLAGVLSFWGTYVEPSMLEPEVYLKKVKGSLPIDLLLAAKRHGFQAETYTGDFEYIKTEIEAGHPLIAFVNFGSTIFPQGHYVVITGYDDGKRGIYINSGPTADRFLSYDEFVKRWEKTGRWTLRILPR